MKRRNFLKAILVAPAIPLVGKAVAEAEPVEPVHGYDPSVFAGVNVAKPISPSKVTLERALEPHTPKIVVSPDMYERSIEILESDIQTMVDMRDAVRSHISSLDREYDRVLEEIVTDNYHLIGDEDD